MPIQYRIIPNYLTNPPSYLPRPIAQSSLDYDAVAKLIHLLNTTIPADTAKAVIEALREVVVSQLGAGNTINALHQCGHGGTA